MLEVFQRLEGQLLHFDMRCKRVLVRMKNASMAELGCVDNESTCRE